MKVNYLFHSGVSVECGSKLLIFDYYKKGIEGKNLTRYDEVYVFVSHSHIDHFDRRIFDWDKNHKGICYVLSDDIAHKHYGDNVIYIGPGEEKIVGDILIKAYKSNDEGVAFLVKTKEGSVFHAGDLNWWYWKGESEEYNKGMAASFKKEIDGLRDIHIDIAFIPIDKRLGYAVYYGIDYLMDNTDVDMVCPIHFWDNHKFLERVKSELAERRYYNKINFYEGKQNEV